MKIEKTKQLIDKLATIHHLSKEEWMFVLEHAVCCRGYLFQTASQIRNRVFGNSIFIRGLIEFTNHCKNDCFYCGIRRSNQNAERYRLCPDEIMYCCRKGYSLGFRTFVLQGGEDLYFSDDDICTLIKQIKESFPDCAVTLSIGERAKESYEAFYSAGADRYLLRHETASENHYGKLHPKNLKLSNRILCLKNLKEIGFQVGCGMMVGSPYQTKSDLAEDMLFLQSFKPHMVGIGPFISHQDTPFKDEPNGSVMMTLILLALTRILLPNALIPATTALNTLDKHGREKGFFVGANVFMPNLSPKTVREKYLLYDNKTASYIETAESLEELKKHLEKIGFQIVVARGDHPEF